MQRAILPLVLFLLAFVQTSCVTSGDIERVADVVGMLESKIDEGATQAELAAAFEAAGDELDAVRRDVEERTKAATESGLSLAEGGGISGGLTALGMLALHVYRSSTRKRALDKVREAPA